MQIEVVREDPLVLLLRLPDGCTAGKWEAVEVFAEGWATLRQQYPDRSFQLVPFHYETLGDGTSPALDMMMAFQN
jgi:hypothetical protein